MKAQKIVIPAAKPKRSTGTNLLTLAICFALTAAVIALAIRYMPRRHNDAGNAARITALANLAALPPTYAVDMGDDMSTERSVWVVHKGASQTARILVSVIERDDPSGRKVGLYYASHKGETCKTAPDALLRAHDQTVRVARTFCNVDGDLLVEEQTVFRISDYYSVSIYEGSEQSQFDYPAFADVVNAVLEARPEGRNHLD